MDTLLCYYVTTYNFRQWRSQDFSLVGGDDNVFTQSYFI